ncbi:hypothetical protein POM88_032919 [Heracleum sosnowskyi]|uniref:E3 ubiquitin protein ligase n=1 Tax=Heracleum sosnowskyi TaxID=360622 RepID=A0AAD8MKJ1_9APIA|nr:hypothetical protein POM88_032919 [Heracleum sosnowskyi]
MLQATEVKWKRLNDKFSLTELNGKAEAVDVAKNEISNAESKIVELEQKLQKRVTENNELEIKMEETLEDSGRKDIKTEFHVMSSAFSKELGLMESQLTRWKEIADEVLSLRENAQSLKALLNEKTNKSKFCVASDKLLKGTCSAITLQISMTKRVKSRPAIRAPRLNIPKTKSHPFVERNPVRSGPKAAPSDPVSSMIVVTVARARELLVTELCVPRSVETAVFIGA